MLRRSLILVASICLFAGFSNEKSSAAAPKCRTVHGRMQVTNGTPSVRIWIVGTKRMLGVVQQDTTFDQLPANIRRAWSDDGKPWAHLLYGDFRVCPLKPYHEGWMQDVRVVGGKNLRRVSP